MVDMSVHIAHPGSMEPRVNQDAQLLRVEDAARLLSISRSQVYELLKARRIASVHIGKSVRIPAQEVTEFVERLATEEDGEK